MQILIIGSKGQLGWELCRQASRYQIEAIGRDLPNIDITDPGSIATSLEDVAPRAVINAAAYTLVDQAETDAEAALAVNRDGPANLATACAQNALPLIHISTDFVFDGTHTRPYVETDAVAPLGVYGRSKAAGEAAVRQATPAHIIIRTAWLYGYQGHNFIKTMLRLAQEHDTIQVVADQQGSPTCAADLARAILQICKAIKEKGQVPWGTYHYCGAGITTWHGLAQETFRLAAAHTALKIPTVTPITTDQYPTPAQRPAYSALNCSKIQSVFGIVTVPWQTSLAATIRQIYSDTPIIN